jgi:hypothetical protein
MFCSGVCACDGAVKHFFIIFSVVEICEGRQVLCSCSISFFANCSIVNIEKMNMSATAA